MSTPPPSQLPSLWTRLLPDLPFPPPPSLSPIPVATMGMSSQSSQADLTTTTTTTPTSHHHYPQPATPGPLLVYGSTLKTCAICLDEYVPGDALRLLQPCGHLFHQPCIDHWLDATAPPPKCPVCNAHVPYAGPHPAKSDTVAQRRQRERATDRNRLHQLVAPRWQNVQLIDVSVHQSWVEWFHELIKMRSAAENGTATSG